jgi:hypothetical protein
VPNAGGAPAVGSVGIWVAGTGAFASAAVAVPSIAADEVIRNSRRDFDMYPSKREHCKCLLAM